jgi:uncharacterized paraquat-inducible protein A
MNTIRWTCKYCDTVNVVVLLEDETEAKCRVCAALADLTIAEPVIVLEPPRGEIHTGGG